MSPTFETVEKKFDLLGTWTEAKKRAEADLAPIKEQYPAPVVRQLLEALTVQHFWELRANQ